MLYLLLSSIASAVPLQYNHQGRLLDVDGIGLEGDHELRFRILDDSDAVLWEESFTVDFSDGFYSVNLGNDEADNPLDDSIFTAYPLWMELSVDGDTLSPTHPIQSVPYASVTGLAENLDGGSVNATEVLVNGIPVIDASGHWVGPADQPDWYSIPNRPPGLDDGDDDTQLDQAGVLNYVNGSSVNLGTGSQVDNSNIVTADSFLNYVNGSSVNLGTGSQVDSSDIVTADSFNSYLSGELTDGDNDTLAELSCAIGEIAAWGANNAWVCTSDGSLEWSDIASMLTANSADLNASTTIGGLPIVTSTTDMDTLNALPCQSGQIAKFDAAQGIWICSNDVFLNQSDVIGYVNGSQVDLGAGSTVNGSYIVTADSYSSYLPADLADGDDDTQLDQTEVVNYVQGQTINLGAGSQVDSSDIVTADSYSSYLPSDLADGDDDTQLSDVEVLSMVEDAGSVNMTGDFSADGTTTFNDAVTAEANLTVNGTLVADTVQGSHGYKEFTTDKIVNSSTTSSQTYTLLNMRCSGHWGSYFVEIDLITYYYRPSVRRYEYYCGNGSYTNGGNLVEVSAPQAVSSLVSLSKTSAVDSGYDHGNISMYDVQLQVTQGAYVQSYARVRTYGYWPTKEAGTPFTTTYPSAVWETWNP